MWKDVTVWRWQSFVGQPVSPQFFFSFFGLPEWQQSCSEPAESSVAQQLISISAWCSSAVKTDAKESTGDRKTSIANKRVSIWNGFFTKAKLQKFTFTTNLFKDSSPWQGFLFKTPPFASRLHTKIRRRQPKHWAMKFYRTWAILQYDRKF